MTNYRSNFKNFLNEFDDLLESVDDVERTTLIEILFNNFLVPDAYTYVFDKKSYSDSEHNELMEEVIDDLLDTKVRDFPHSFSQVKGMLADSDIHHIYLHKQSPSRLKGGADEYYKNLVYTIEKIADIYGEELSEHRVDKISTLSQSEKDLIATILPLFLQDEVDYEYKLLNSRSITRVDIEQINEEDDEEEESVIPIDFSTAMKLCMQAGLAHRNPRRVKYRGKYLSFPMSALNVLLETEYGDQLITTILEEGFKESTDRLIDHISRAELKFIRNTILDFGSREVSLRTFSFPHLQTKDIIDIIRSDPQYFKWLLENPEEVGTKGVGIKLRKIGVVWSKSRIWGGRLLLSTAFLSIILNLITSYL